MQDQPDGVTNIHSRFSLTLINPASHYFSLAGSLAAAAVIAVAAHAALLPGGLADEWYRVPALLAVLAATQLLDTRFTKKKEYSKSLHSSLFACMLWAATVLFGILAGAVLSKEASPFFVTLGMFLFASFRIGVYTTTLGAGLARAWAVCFVQPAAMFAVLLPAGLWGQALSDPVALGYGAAFLVLASVWSAMTDRAGRPGMESTHRTIQAYLASQKGDYADAEEIMEGRSSEARVSTAQIRLSRRGGGGRFSMVLPEIHPGPYHPVGGSNIPYLIYKSLGSSAMVMHSISDHALNLPSRGEVESYLRGLAGSSVADEGLVCTEPVSVQINRARVTGLLFGSSPLLFLSLSPHGMEDVPSYMKSEIEGYAANRGCKRTMIVDCHNAMGPEISGADGQDMLKAAKSCLDSLVSREGLPIEYGYANSDGTGVDAVDLGMGGLGVVCLGIGGSRYYVAWADANNMENGVREKIVAAFAARGMRLLEVCTSDTHYQPVRARNRNGYYQLGLVTGAARLSEWLLEIAERAGAGAAEARYEILEAESSVRVMGRGIFEDYSRALDNSLKITKGFAIGGCVLFATSLFL